MSLRGLVVLACLLFPVVAHAQVQTGSITGVVSDTSGAVLPGVNVTISSDRLIGGEQTFTTDVSGAYGFDRLPPGDYRVKFELQGFKTVEQSEVRVNAAFVATINARREVGSLEETITVTGQSRAVDVRSNVQQTVMSQEILEGLATIVIEVAGVPVEDASLVATSLSDANLCGHDSHALLRLPQYLDCLKQGIFKPGAPAFSTTIRAGFSSSQADQVL